ncbi:MAG: methyltransferase domain-containing protein [Candidatus Paceibacterota bacterium]|jgi:cyclopropane fatty-acyl-phospholipid synthase-like methyltransferase
MKDTFGKQLFAQYKNRKLLTEIVERDDGFIEESSYASRYFNSYKKWSRIEKEAMKLIKGPTLDIGCGAGRHALYLQKKGVDVVGIDNSPLAIKICKLRGLKNTKILSIDEVEKIEERHFNSILMLGNNFGLFGSSRKIKTILKKLDKITTKKCKIIAECVDPYNTKNPVHLKYHKFNKKRNRMPGQLRLRINYNNIKGEWFDYLFVSIKEIDNLLKHTNWKISEVLEENKSIYIVILEKNNFMLL